MTFEFVANTCRQEKERFARPTHPYFFDIEGKRSIVSNLRKHPPGTAKRSREHPLLVENRAYHISLVNLVINAGARLPGGVGTRADVAELMRDSCYVKESATVKKINSVVSAALDRIQLIPDSPLVYDSDQKLWIYTHRLRTLAVYRKIAQSIGEEFSED